MNNLLLVSAAWALAAAFMYGGLIVNKVGLTARLYVGMLVAAVLTFVGVFIPGLTLLVAYQVLTFPW